ncbi:MAG: hypothetical protein GON13_02680 [Nanoarchaeota archaeon]|nr:hypothetical protein [Nanoarchaeota archaeon]
MVRMVLIFVLLVTPVFANPQAILVENLTLNQYYNNSIINSTSKGYVQVITPSNDVLQYIRINLSSITSTNLESVTAYRATAASPNIGDRTFLFLNTSASSQDLSYTFNVSQSSNLIIDWVNLDSGGHELVKGSNTLNFTIRINASVNNTPANFSIIFFKNVLGINDSANLSNASSGVIIDSDSDGFNDLITWSGIAGTEPFIVYFTVRIIEGINWDGYSTHQLVDYAFSSFDNPNTFTNISVSDLFSRGPIREGVEMIISPEVRVRGFIKNVADELVYNISQWSIYEVNNSTPKQEEIINVFLSPSQDYFTEWLGADKSIYYSSSFDWKSIWNSTIYENNLITNTYFPFLDLVNSEVYKLVQIATNEVNRELIITDKVQNLGTSNTNFTTITSKIPYYSEYGYITWYVDSVNVYYYNGSLIPITASISTFYNKVVVSSDKILFPNDMIIVSYQLSSKAANEKQQFSFSVDSLIRTLSGTVFEKNTSKIVTIPSSEDTIIGGGGGGDGIISERLSRTGFEVITNDASAFNNFGNITSGVIANDNTGEGISNVKAYLYLYNDSVLNESSVKAFFYDSSIDTWIQDDVIIASQGDGVYLIEREWGDWLMYDSDLLNINYLTFLRGKGVHTFGTEFFGYSPSTGKIISEEITSYLVSIIETGSAKPIITQPLIVAKSGFIQGNCLVGEPVEWYNNITVYNPNNFEISQPFTIKIFSDALSSTVEGEITRLIADSSSLSVSWVDSIKSQEYKTFLLTVYTPPIIETLYSTSFTTYNSTAIRLFTSSTLENTALEDYENVSYNMKTSFAQIFEVSSDDGVLEFEKENNVLLINIPLIGALTSKPVKISSLEYPPKITITTDKKFLNPNDFLKINVSAITKTDMAYAMLELDVVGPMNSFSVVYADVKEFTKINAFDEISFFRELLLELPSGEYLVLGSLKKDYLTLASETYYFTISGNEKAISIIWIIPFFFMFFVVILAKRNKERLISAWRILNVDGVMFLNSQLKQVKKLFKHFKRSPKPKRMVKHKIKPKPKKRKIRKRISEEQKLLRRIDNVLKRGGNV